MIGRWLRRIALLLGGIVLVILVVGLAYVGRVAWSGKTAVATVAGTRSGMPVDGPVTIARDERGVPHIRAGSLHDLFVAEGYTMASDRLFQMDLTRRYVDGRLAELLGAPLARVDRRMRRYAIRPLAAQVYAHSSRDEQAALSAFADGINAAATHEPSPPEYAALLAGFEPWRPEDALVVGFSTLLDLDDKPDDVVIRDEVRNALGPAGPEALYPLTDPKYDVPTNGRPPGPIAALPALHGASNAVALAPADDRAPIGSNGWAVGADRTTVGKAILANDPHLSISIPGIWYLLEARAPGVHVAGGALAGTPGVTLGHNEHLAWGVTAAETASPIRVVRERMRGTDELYEQGRWVHARHRHDSIAVRFGSALDSDTLVSDRGVVIARSHDGAYAYLMDWRMQHAPVSPLAPFFALLRARNAAEGVAAMRANPEPALNVLFADDGGRAAYHFSGGVPLDPSFGRWANDASAPEPPYLTYDRSPHIDPSRSAVIVTSNNRSDGAGSPRLAPYWPPPYRAFEVGRALRVHGRTLSPEDIAAVQSDVASPAEGEFAHLVLAAAYRARATEDRALGPLLASVVAFDGRMSSESRGASAVVALRRDMLAAISAAQLPPWLAPYYPSSGPGFEVVLRALRERPRGWVPHDDYDAFVVASLRRVKATFGATVPTFGEYAAQPLAHPLAPFGFGFWNGPTMPGRGGSFAPDVQWNGHAQSFRAVWIAGDWDRGTIDIAAGESGEPGSPHYADQNARWTHFVRTPMPFSDAAVSAATKSTLTLTR